MNTRILSLLPRLTCFSLLLAPCAVQAGGDDVTIDQIATGIRKHISVQSKTHGGFFKVPFKGKELNLDLVRVHLEYLSDLGDGVRFACVDLVDRDGTVYDLDFYMKGQPGDMTVTKTSVHKINGRPLYLWQQNDDGTWHHVPVKDAPPKLLGILHGSDKFEFIYRTWLPEIKGNAQLWLPLATTSMFQRVKVTSIHAPGKWSKLHESKYGNEVLILSPKPSDSGKMIEIRYQVQRFEKSEYAVRDPDLKKYLQPSALVPSNKEFRDTARKVVSGKTDDMDRARALYDYVQQNLRYARYGTGWGRGDAVHACDSQAGNCSDFHSYFIALSRAVGIPARFAIGAAIPSERNDGGISGYHCWAEFYADGRWVPVDISEANKLSSLSDYYFGHNPANRFELSRGRDLLVKPAPASGPINFLAYPLLEVNGKEVHMKTEFLFQRGT